MIKAVNVNNFYYRNNISNKRDVTFKGFNNIANDVMVVAGKETKAKIFAKEIEEEAVEQIKQLCDMPVFKNAKIRIMPDVSAGNNCVVGFTAKLSPEKIKELPPSLIGNDIGCGVLMVKTDAKIENLDLPAIDNFIRTIMPTNWKLRPEMPVELRQDIKTSCNLYGRDENKVYNQVGTLGNGNHFIEIDSDTEGNLYLAIHTGSRQFGSYIKEYYEKLQAENKQCSDMNYAEAVSMAQKYAKFNRESIATMILNKFKIKPLMQFDCPHNYISENGMVHKGSIDASAGKPVLIPLNMRDGMIIGKGKGNTDWNCSAPHGSGRKMSRYKARQHLSLNEYIDSMRGIYSTCIGKRSIDESPAAYKNSSGTADIIRNTVDIETFIKPIYNYKKTSGK